MPIEIKKEIELEIGHVLFIDIVGYSKLLIDEQRDYLHTLNEVVRRNRFVPRSRCRWQIDAPADWRRNGAGFCDHAGRPSFLRDRD